jgi:hypothetical protein
LPWLRKGLPKRISNWGIQVPRNVTEAIALDRENGNTLWQDATKKEMDACKIAFKVLNPDEPTTAPVPRQCLRK